MNSSANAHLSLSLSLHKTKNYKLVLTQNEEKTVETDNQIIQVTCTIEAI